MALIPLLLGSSEADLVLIQDLSTAFIVVVSAIVISSVILAFILKKYWIRQLRNRRRHSLEDSEFDRSLSLNCRGRSLPPPYSLEDAGTRLVTPPVEFGAHGTGGAHGALGRGAHGGVRNNNCLQVHAGSKDDCVKHIETTVVHPPSYISIENSSHGEPDTSSFVVFISNIQHLLSLQTQGGEEFLRLLETQPRYLLDVLQQHQQENQDCILNQQ